jgi:hypothetical protein
MDAPLDSVTPRPDHRNATFGALDPKPGPLFFFCTLFLVAIARPLTSIPSPFRDSFSP